MSTHRLAAIAVAALTATAAAQAPPPAPLQVPNPTYTSIAMEINVNRPAADVWKRIGKYCDIGEWLQIPCTITSGKDGELGAVRSVANEILVGKTELSYVYTQPVREGRIYNMYHGTLEARPVTATTSKIVYTLFFDNSNLADQAAKDADTARRRTQFTRAVENMKILAEGGTLPPPPARGASSSAASTARSSTRRRCTPATSLRACRRSAPPDRPHAQAQLGGRLGQARDPVRVHVA